MKVCPKCRSFYDDASLIFCQTDGVPLIRLNQSNELWTEGTEAIKTTREIVSKQFRIQKLKNLAKILVTSFLTMLIISEIVRNTDFYPPTDKDEKAKSSSPSPIVKPTKENLSNIKTTPSTKTNTSVNNNSCSDQDRNKNIPELIKRNNYEELKSSLQEGERDFRAKFEATNKFSFDRIKIVLNFEAGNIEVNPGSDCRHANVTVNFFWFVAPNQNVQVKDELGNAKFTCDKDGEKWICKKSSN